jgi:hypothetical protein
MKIRKLITVFVIAIFFMFLVSTLSILKADSNLVIKRFTINAYGIFDTTPEIYAGLYDMTEAGWDENVRNKIAQVKAIKTDFNALVYRNMRSVESSRPEWATFVANGWLLKDSLGNIIPTDVGYLVDIGSAGYQAWIASYLNTQISSLGYDGVFADNSLFYGTGDHFYRAAATPINPRTNRPWTSAEVRQALLDLHVAIKNAIGSKLLCCNGIFCGSRFYDHQSAYQEFLSSSPMDGFMSEGAWYPNYDNPQWMSEQTWVEAVNFLVWIQDNWLAGHSNRFYVPVCKLAYGNQAPTSLPSGATREQMATYTYASTLLGAKTNQADQIYFSTFTDSAFNLQMQSLYDIDVGTPTNNAYAIGGTHVYARDFSNGKVLVNPTDYSYTVNLGLTRFVNAATGQLVPQTITIPPHTGGVLTVAAGPSPSPSPTPSISLQTEKTTYARGQTLTAYIQGFNLGPATTIRVNVWFGLPRGGTYAYETYFTGTIPAAYTSPVYVWKSLTIPYSAASGTYSVNAEMRNPSTNALIDSDTYYFTIS